MSCKIIKIRLDCKSFQIQNNVHWIGLSQDLKKTCCVEIALVRGGSKGLSGIEEL